MSVLRVGLAGAGWVAAHHLDGWATQSHRATVVAVADPHGEAARARAAQCGIPATYTSPHAMLAEARLDIIDIAAPREAHAELCRAAANRGVAILCQKPLAPTLAEAEAVVADVGDRVPFMVHENWRFRPHYRQMKQWLEQDFIGGVRTAVMTVFTSGLVAGADGSLPALERQPMLAGLERMLVMEILIHHIDTLRFLLGPLTLRGAVLGRSCAQLAGEDRAILLLRADIGAGVTIAGDFMGHGHPAEQRDRLELLGTHGSIRLRADELRLEGRESRVLTLDLAANYKASYAGAIAHFLDGLERGMPFETGPADNLETLRIVEAAYRLGS